MTNLILNNKLKSKTWFIVLCVCFCLYILLLSFLYPYTSDEIRGFCISFEELWNYIKFCFLNEAPRFMNLPLSIVSYLGTSFVGKSFSKILFCILNPLMQISIVYGLFYVVKGRKLKIDSWQDFFPFLLICMTYLLMTPSQSNTLFWISATTNYSWAFLFCLFILCLYRKGLKQEFIKDTFLVKILCLFCGFVAGMSNENTGPMMIGVSLCFIIWSKYKKVKLPQYIYYAFVGVLLGVGAMFGLGGSVNRLNSNQFYKDLANDTIFNRLFVSIYHITNFLKAIYFIPIINIIILLLLLYDKKLSIIKNQKFILSSFMLICGLILAFVLFLAPMVSDRAYYSAGMFCIISFIILADLLYDIYHIYFIKYLSLICTIYFLIIMPLVVVPYISLYNNLNYRETLIYQAKIKGKKEIFVMGINPISAPTQNLTIFYLDNLTYTAKPKDIKKWYGINVYLFH